MTLNRRGLLLLVAAAMAGAAVTTVVVASGMHAPHGSRPLLTEAELAAPGAVASPDRLVALRLEAPAAVPEKGDTGGRGGDAFSLHFDRATRHVVRIDPADVHRLRARVTDPAGVVVLELDGAHPEGVLAARPGTYRLEVLRNEDGRGTILTRCAVQDKRGTHAPATRATDWPCAGRIPRFSCRSSRRPPGACACRSRWARTLRHTRRRLIEGRPPRYLS